MIHAVYRFFAESGKCLYIGCTERLRFRISEQMGAHEELQTFGRIEVTYHPTRQGAFDVEQAEIRRLQPTINIRGLRDENPAMPKGDLRVAVIAAVAELGECTTSDVADAHPELPRASIATTMLRLRSEGVVDVVGKRYSGHGAGRPQFVVRVAEAAA